MEIYREEDIQRTGSYGTYSEFIETGSIIHLTIKPEEINLFPASYEEANKIFIDSGKKIYNPNGIGYFKVSFQPYKRLESRVIMRIYNPKLPGYKNPDPLDINEWKKGKKVAVVEWTPNWVGHGVLAESKPIFRGFQENPRCPKCGEKIATVGLLADVGLKEKVVLCGTCAGQNGVIFLRFDLKKSEEEGDIVGVTVEGLNPESWDITPAVLWSPGAYGNMRARGYIVIFHSENYYVLPESKETDGVRSVRPYLDLVGDNGQIKLSGQFDWQDKDCHARAHYVKIPLPIKINETVEVSWTSKKTREEGETWYDFHTTRR